MSNDPKASASEDRSEARTGWPTPAGAGDEWEPRHE